LAVSGRTRRPTAARGDTDTVSIVGANEEAKKDYMFGLDYVLIRPVE